MAYLDFLLYDLLLLLVAYAYVIGTIIIPVTLKKKDKISSFTARKMVHLLAGLVVLIVPFFVWKGWATIIASTMVLMTYFSSKDSSVKTLSDLYDAIGEEAEENVGTIRKRAFLQGPFHYALSITTLVTIFAIIAPDRMYFPISGILIMIISDTLASMVGKKYGKIKIKFSWTSERSLEGSLTFFGTAFLLCLFTFSFYGTLIPTQAQLSLEQVLLYALITSALGTVIELLSPSTWDDLSVPITTTLIIFLLSLI